MPEINEILECHQERGNPEDLYMYDTNLVNYIQLLLSSIANFFWLFFEHSAISPKHAINTKLYVLNISSIYTYAPNS